MIYQEFPRGLSLYVHAYKYAKECKISIFQKNLIPQIFCFVFEV